MWPMGLLFFVGIMNFMYFDSKIENVGHFMSINMFWIVLHRNLAGDWTVHVW